MSRSGLARVLLFIGILEAGGLAKGQSVVPGGWDVQMGWQSFSLVGYGGALGVFAESAPYFSSTMTAGSRGLSPFSRSFSPDGGLGHEAQVVNTLIPLSQTIRRQTRRRGAR